MPRETSARAPSPPEPDRATRTRTNARGELTRESLVRCGVELCTERGFQVTGIELVLKRVGIPKGSFYHHFADKHEFGEAVIESYAAFFQKMLDRTLSDASVLPLQRLRNFIAEAERGMAKFQFQRGCLVGNMGQELGGLDERFRLQLEDVLLSWQATMANCLRDAISRGEIRRTVDPDQLAAFFWIGWEGAILRAKLTRDAKPMKLFARMFFELIGKKYDV
jgi:TetR/AcrR family transcriptional repressor of nem operon